MIRRVRNGEKARFFGSEKRVIFPFLQVVAIQIFEKAKNIWLVFFITSHVVKIASPRR